MTVDALLSRAQRVYRRHFADVFTADTGISARQFDLLREIEDEPIETQRALIRNTGIDRTTLSQMLRSLEARDLLVRIQNKSDRRAYIVHLTPKGKRLLKLGASAAREAHARFMSPLTGSQIVTLTKLLERCIG